MLKNKLKIPEGWRIEKLGNVSTIIKGEQLNKLNMIKSGHYPALNGGINPSGYTDKWNTQENTIAISEGGNSCGYVNFVEEKFWCGGHCYAVNPNDGIDNIFLYQYLKYKQNDLMKLRVGSGLPNIQRKGLEDFSLLISTPKEQQKIAEILGVVDEDIEKTDEVIKQTEKIKRGLMSDLLTKGIGHTKFKKTKLGEIPESWEISNLVGITKLIKDGTHGSHKSYQTGIPLLSAKDIIDGQITLNNSPRLISQVDFDLIHKGYEIKKGDILLTVVGTIGRVSLVKDYSKKFSVQRSVAILRFSDDLLPEFYYHLLCSDLFQNKLKEKARGAAQVGVYLASLGSIQVFKIPFPEQQKIAEVLSSVDEKILKNKELKNELIKLKKGLMSDLLGGKIRTS